MATSVMAQNPVFAGQIDDSRINSGSQYTRLPELNPIMEEEHDEEEAPDYHHHQEEEGQETITDPTVVTETTLGDGEKENSPVQLPPVADARKEVVLTESRLLEALGLSQNEEQRATALLLDTVRCDVMSALEELRTITTHDDNLEKQYKETVAENTKLRSDLEKAWREIRHLRGQLSILKMTAPEIRQERARMQQKQKQRMEREKQVQQQREKYANEGVQVLSAAERARTVNARGEYIDYHNPRQVRGLTHPASTLTKHTPTLPTLPPAKLKKLEPLPPPLPGCTCSVCTAKQSMGALTLGKGECLYQKAAGQITKSGQQILLGDRVIIKGERIGTVCYIGKLDFDIYEHVYVGVHLDMPIGNSDGSLKGRRYFQCPPNHGVFVRATEVICVTGRKPVSGGTSVPRVREKLPTGLQLSRGASRTSKTPLESDVYVPSEPVLSRTTPTMSQVKTIVESELAALKDKDPNELADDSVATMSKRIKELSQKHQKLSEEATKTELPSIVEPSSEGDALSDLPPRPHAPLPLTPSPIATVTSDEEGYRPVTPLERSLLDFLSDKDLGSTGFVTANELAAVLMQLEPEKALSSEQVEQLFSQLGISSEDGVGIAYHSLLPVFVQAIEEFHKDDTV